MKDATRRATDAANVLRITVLGLALVLLGGCAVGPNYVRPEVPVMKEWSGKGDTRLKDGPAELAVWWKRLNDPVLDRLVEMARERNPSLQVAGLRILEARARLGIATGNRFPQLQQLKGNLADNGLSKHNANTSPALDTYYATASVALDAAWELDFWGKFRRAVESGVWDLDAATAGYDDLLVTLTAEVARVYVTLRTLEERLDIARENVAVQERSLQIARALYEGGDVTELDVAQARALLANTRASMPRLDAQLRQAKNGLAALLGMLPGEVDDLLGAPGRIPEVPADLAVGVPAELLRRRPDIRAAEARMAAQCALIGVARADLYPHA
ncbi:NodT family efflux transporter outer membrane factor (OMF) lipoprotein [Desulfomicrobium macestii]|uniref:NodT family efflux transporter outer membrane factor (OMF) lipoprotein n=1 Tax=Desulfomicrobium macestii TaxID=90731 RepID=A0ABR9H196_9BACT|nr:efflux transporter outer membrane subunit [Desulfomicrobium macestii]MBE1424476.1 NodT family efflux transporter outer membrane factor (OMF) lipoprotein [Desulfomicrobium macestii]